MADAFENIFGQPRVRDFLRASVRGGHVSQAYLFCGPAGSSKTAAAYALAQAYLCPKGAKGPRGGLCGACDACSRIARRKHPDVRYYAPEGAGGYLVEQIREIVSDVSYAPIQAKSKVYILDRVDMLGTAAANAFLKTLEEPPANVMIVLLGRTRESVLPTIVSRCQVVPFRHIPATEAAGIIRQNTGASIETARIAVEACSGSITRACEFLKSNDSLAFRRGVVDAMSRLATADDWDIIELAAGLVRAAKAPLDDVRAALEAELSENADFLAKSAIRQIEARNKRQITAKTSQALHQVFSIASSWLRDVMATCAGTPEFIVNVDVRAQIEMAAARTDEARAAAALAALRESDEAISYNVSPETCIDAMLFEVREVLYGSSRAH